MRYGALAAIAGLAACLAGCSLTPSGGECVSDSQCGDDVCARGGECAGRTNVRSVMVKWTIDGATASATTCAAHPYLFLQFDGADYGDRLAFSPVACSQGSFFVDKLPKRYQQVGLGIGGPANTQPIDVTTAQATFNLVE